MEKYKIWLNKFKKTSKGWILTYVVIVGMIISLTICYSMKSFVNRNSYIKNYVEYNLKENHDHSYKERLMASFNRYVLENIETINTETLNKYFETRAGEKLITYDNSYITYDLKEKLFQINGLNKIYKFTMNINEDSVIYISKGNLVR
ncbi:hypothetical protein [uncultured Clostridium sp.]|uniref:hypothetical protein n=1 Tax=uncultured Clostridium sp. TaxID=59620 RepID=UPI003217A46F